MKTGLLILAILFIRDSFSQTNLIFHKSHSGSKSVNFNSFAAPLSNFGAYPTERIQNAVLDSVIYISDSTAVMITSIYCPKQSVRFNQGQNEKNKRTNYGHLWSEGRDTVRYHPLFSHPHALDSIREVLREQYNFTNDIDSTKFVGYDNQSTIVKGKNQVPPNLAPTNTERNELYLILLFVGSFFTFSMVFSRKTRLV